MVSAGDSAGGSGGTLKEKEQDLEGVTGDGGWCMHWSKAGGTGSETGPACSVLHIGRSQEQESQQPPYVPQPPGHTVLTGLGPPTSAECGPHSSTELSKFHFPCGFHTFQDPGGADLGFGALCFPCRISWCVRKLSPHFHFHFLHHCLGSQGRFVGCNSPWVLLHYLVLQWEAYLLG